MHSLGLDIGSTTIKGVVLGPDGEIHGQIERHPFPAPIAGLPSGFFEIDPVEVFQAVRLVLKQLLAKAPHAKRLFLCGQMGGVILSDRFGKPLTRYISWRDQRSLRVEMNGRSLLDRVQELIHPDIYVQIGQELKAGSTSVLLHGFIQGGTSIEGAYPATIADAVAAHLCCVSPRMHPTMAIGMIDLCLPAPSWHEGLIAALKLESLEWTKLATVNAPIGETVIDGLKLEVFSAVGDQQAALLGVGLQEGELSLNVSTGAQVSRIVGEMKPGHYQSRCYFGGKVLETITHIPAGRSLHAIIDVLTEISRTQGLDIGDPWNTVVKLMDQIDFNPDGHNLKVGLSFFPSPVGNKGYVNEITLDNFSVGNIMVSAIWDLAENLFRCSKHFGADSCWNQIRLSGGISHTLPQLLRFLSYQFETHKIVESRQVEETLTGLAKLSIGYGLSEFKRDFHVES